MPAPPRCRMERGGRARSTTWMLSSLLIGCAAVLPVACGQSACNATQYCSSSTSRCMAPSISHYGNISTTPTVCWTDSTCDPPAVCDPVTKMCAFPGDECTAPSGCGTGSYCSPTTKECATPIDTVVCSVTGSYSYSRGSCAQQSSGPEIAMCSPGTRICVHYGQKDCDPTCGYHSASYCNLDGKCATPASRPGATIPSECETCAKTPIPCEAASDCDAGLECCPLTRLCVALSGSCSRTSSSPFMQNCSSTEVCSATSDSSIARHVCMKPTFTKQHGTCQTDGDCPATKGVSCDPVTQLCVVSSGACEPR
eukprot:COSAG02_NODE_857_length_16462_cov_4.801381_15_plen_311_part_00